MALGTHHVTDKEKTRILKLHEEGLSYELISRRIGRTSRTVARVVKQAKVAAKKEASNR